MNITKKAIDRALKIDYNSKCAFVAAAKAV